MKKILLFVLIILSFNMIAAEKSTYLSPPVPPETEEQKEEMIFAKKVFTSDCFFNQSVYLLSRNSIIKNYGTKMDCSLMSYPDHIKSCEAICEENVNCLNECPYLNKISDAASSNIRRVALFYKDRIKSNKDCNGQVSNSSLTPDKKLQNFSDDLIGIEQHNGAQK